LFAAGSENAVPRIYRPKAFRAELGIGHTKYHEDIKKGLIPPPVSLGPRSKGHPEEDLELVIARLKAERDAKQREAA
jgi:predicted DNA-binding transcriptional regulator AlpA